MNNFIDENLYYMLLDFMENDIDPKTLKLLTSVDLDELKIKMDQAILKKTISWAGFGDLLKGLYAEILIIQGDKVETDRIDQLKRALFQFFYRTASTGATIPLQDRFLTGTDFNFVDAVHVAVETKLVHSRQSRIKRLKEIFPIEYIKSLVEPDIFKKYFEEKLYTITLDVAEIEILQKQAQTKVEEYKKKASNVYDNLKPKSEIQTKKDQETLILWKSILTKLSN